ncbi:hypothetical protein THAOC_02714 [Thalassiosira oceanica]|uniref:Glycosyl transferase family 1 domain-containing protein n=1 Tax=Thalassiosira oceanica TaxID=159749 RepID=K0TLS0_THAOC|nr:hypothetical protein THAOC_02714 [Thalassiosira oceanica]|eukprot:EJK75556.1 hypothetical protein THAOC_02714 [Thalassiosira oceanica]
MRRLCSLAALLVALVSTAVAERKRIALMTASFPWTFGPYQAQMYELSLILDSSGIEYDISWVTTKPLRRGVYRTWEDVPKTGVVDPPEGFRVDHLTFVGNGWDDGGTLSASRINALGREHGFDHVVTLMDITKCVPDEPFRQPVTAWIPLHSETVRKTSVDYWVLRSYHGIAALSPSGARAMEDAVGAHVDYLDDGSGEPSAMGRMRGAAQVDFVPHVINRRRIAKNAEDGLRMLEKRSVAEVDSALSGQPIVDNIREPTLRPDTDESLFGRDSTRKDDFVVLIQGGNYDAEDRKGWDTSIQAYARFYNSLSREEREETHLLIHSFESYLMSSDDNNNMDAPAAVMPIGLAIELALRDIGMPYGSYTVDIAQHDVAVVAAYKKRASVCLHPSKVEGFGMNVLECQSVGTPVITTNYTAMADFTKVGIAVPHRQMLRAPGAIYDLALPDVEGIADALREMHGTHLAMKRGDQSAMIRRQADVTEFNGWVDRTMSPRSVGERFEALFARAELEFESRAAGRLDFRSGRPPTVNAVRVVTGYHTPVVDWDEPWTLLAPDGLRLTNVEAMNSIAWSLLLDDGTASSMVAIVPARYLDDGSHVPAMGEGGRTMNDDLPMMVRTFMIKAFQGRMTRMKTMKVSAITNEGNPKQFPDGFALIERNVGAVGGRRELLDELLDEL